MAPLRATDGERGAAMVEFALLLPVLLLVLFGIIQFGRAYNAKIELSGAVREGARAAALGKTDAEVREIVRSAAPAVTLADDDIRIRYFIEEEDGTETEVADTTDDSGCSSALDASKATVSARFQLDYVIPFLGGDWADTWGLSAKGVMRCGL